MKMEMNLLKTIFYYSECWYNSKYLKKQINCTFMYLLFLRLHFNNFDNFNNDNGFVKYLKRYQYYLNHFDSIYTCICFEEYNKNTKYYIYYNKYTNHLAINCYCTNTNKSCTTDFKFIDNFDFNIKQISKFLKTNKFYFPYLFYG